MITRLISALEGRERDAEFKAASSSPAALLGILNAKNDYIDQLEAHLASAQRWIGILLLLNLFLTGWLIYRSLA